MVGRAGTGALSRCRCGHGGTRRRDSRAAGAGAGVAAGAPAALHRRHERESRRSARSVRPVGLQDGPRRPVHLSRAGSAGGLRHAQPRGAQAHGPPLLRARPGAVADRHACRVWRGRCVPRWPDRHLGRDGGRRRQDRGHRGARAPVGHVPRRLAERRPRSRPLPGALSPAAFASTASPRSRPSGSRPRWQRWTARSGATSMPCSAANGCRGRG